MLMHPMDIILILMVTACGITDIFHGKIYNPVTYAGILAGFLIALLGYGAPTLAGNPVTVPDALFGFLVGFLPFFAVYLIGGVGGGDVKLIAAIGTFKGAGFISFTMIYALALGAFFGVVVAAFRGQLLPILKRVGYTLLHTVTPGVGPTSYLDKDGPRVNFGFAICLGTLLCLLGQALGTQIIEF
jgi:prepilin peptidase CpaA